jgi:hypothetical protein
MADVKISDLPNAATALGTMSVEVNDSGTSRRTPLSAVVILSNTNPVFAGPATLQGVRVDVIGHGSVVSGTVTFDVSIAAVQTVTVGGTQTWAFSNWGSEYGEVEIIATNAGAAAVTLPTINWLKGDGTKSTTFADMGVTLQASGVNHFIVWTPDGGTTLYGRAA